MLDDETYDRFKYYCRRHGLKISTKLDLLIQQEMDEEYMKKYEPLMNLFKKINGKPFQEATKIEHQVRPVVQAASVVSIKAETPTIDRLRYRKGL